ncbi:hypothetical protein D9M73_291930 [compost metagenome]
MGWKCVKLMPGTPLSTSMTWVRPDLVPRGRSTWVMSPVITAVEPKPMRVRNIFICSTVVFWLSSRMMKLLFRVRPRM